MTATDRPVTVPPSTRRTRTAFWRVPPSALAVAGTAGLVLAPHGLADPVGTAGSGLLAALWLVVLIAAQVALAGIPEQVAFARAYLLVPFLSWAPTLFVAEWYLAAGARFPAARPGT